MARYRRGVTLAIVLLAAFLLLTVQVRHDRAVVTLARQAILFTVAPFIKLTALTVGGASTVWHDYVDLRNVRQNNLRLQREATFLQRRIDQLEEQVLETQRLQGLLAMRESWRAKFLAARVVGKDATNWFKTILIDRGSQSGLRRNLPVVAPDGLVGRVVEVTFSTAKVQLITDPVSASGALMQRTRVTGIVTGNLGAGLRIRYLPLLADVVVGDEVVTSGMGGVFPKGIPVGRVTAVERKSGALFQEAALQPKVDLGRLEEVLILMGGEQREGFESGSRRQP
ncbi:MAG: rod shape-determining protein MreC [candidate division NC10 bacterium RBG_16_65_8]|nr:MAG: rod shape-determining protein MreC [candidate division NC10 bacterium RBG_16_65_8]